MAVPRPIRWLPRQRVPTSALSFRDLAAETRWLLGFACLYVLASCLTGFLISRFRMPIWGATDFLQDVWYTVFFKVGLLLVLPLVVYRSWGYRFGDLLYGWRPTLRSIAVLVVCYAIGLSINLGRIDEIRTAWALHAPGEAVTRAALGVVIAFLQAGIPEEVVYRGLLQSRLESSWGRLPAIIVSVTLFVAWHIPTRFFLAHGVEGEAGDLGSVLLGTGVPVGIVGIVFAWAWDRHRNLPALIAIHGGVDTLPIVASMLQSVPIGHR
jgi:membrane protease YdiL (CAAX protease family)